MTPEALLERLVGVRPLGTHRWSARCPAHQPDKNPSLSIRVAGTRLLVKCWTGCETSQIMAALGLTMADLFTDSSTSKGQRFTPKPQKFDLVAVAHRFEVAALDRRLRADAVLKAIARSSGEEMNDLERDQLMSVIALAYEDQDRAAFLESAADDLRVKALEERTRHHAA